MGATFLLHQISLIITDCQISLAAIAYMKRSFVILLIALTTVMAHGQMLSQGTWELDVSGNYDHRSAAGKSFWTALGVGYFVVDNLEVAVAGAYIYNDYQTGYHPAVGIQYNIDLGMKLVPFFGGDLGWGYWDNKNADNQNGFVYGIDAGLKYFLVENVALSASVHANWSNDDLWVEDEGKMVNNDLSRNLGLRFYF